MCSTRRTQRRRVAAYRKHAAAVAAAAEAVAAAEAAVVAEAVVAAADVAVAAAVCRGDLAGFAKPDGFPTTLTKAEDHGRVRQGRPGQSMFCPSPF
jgi:hypothetical protein